MADMSLPFLDGRGWSDAGVGQRNELIDPNPSSTQPGHHQRWRCGEMKRRCGMAPGSCGEAKHEAPRGGLEGGRCKKVARRRKGCVRKVPLPATTGALLRPWSDRETLLVVPALSWAAPRSLRSTEDGRTARVCQRTPMVKRRCPTPSISARSQPANGRRETHSTPIECQKKVCAGRCERFGRNVVDERMELVSGRKCRRESAALGDVRR